MPAFLSGNDMSSVRFETCPCGRRASFMPRAFGTIELMTCEPITRLLRYAVLATESCEALLGSTIGSCFTPEILLWKIVHRPDDCVEKDQDALLLVPAMAFPARQRDSWPIQCNFDFPWCGDWLLTLDIRYSIFDIFYYYYCYYYYYYFGKREPMKTATANGNLPLGLMISFWKCSPEDPEGLPKSFSRAWENIHCRGRPKWNSGGDRGSPSGRCPCPTSRCAGLLVQPRRPISTSSRLVHSIHQFCNARHSEGHGHYCVC